MRIILYDESSFVSSTGSVEVPISHDVPYDTDYWVAEIFSVAVTEPVVVS